MSPLGREQDLLDPAMQSLNPLVVGLWGDLGAHGMEGGLRRPLEIIMDASVLAAIMRDRLGFEPLYRWPKFGGKEMPADTPTSVTHHWSQGPDEALEAMGQMRHPPYFGAVM